MRVDIAFFLTNVREQLEEGTFTVIPYATNLFYTFWAGVEPIDDLNVRRALVHAVDWQTGYLGGLGRNPRRPLHVDAADTRASVLQGRQLA